MIGCPELGELEEFVRHKLDSRGQTSIEAHLSTCPTCAHQLEEVAHNLNEEGLIRELRGSAPGPWSSFGELAAPSSIGGFRILKELGRGGMGIVYLAEQLRPKRLVALKVIRPILASPDARPRFEQEANLLAQLRHPGIAQIYEVGVAEMVDPSGIAESVPYFAMEFIEGERVDTFVQKRDLSWRQKVELLARVCEAVEHAHQRGIVHRDLKPDNILVQEPSGPRTDTGEGDDAIGQPKILDFGVARVTSNDFTALTMGTSTGQLIGSLPYMSPEQVRADRGRVDARSDIYALGVLGYVLLAGRLPYNLSGRSLIEAGRVIQEEEPSSIGTPEARRGGDLETILWKALEKDPDRRYATAAALAADLRHLLHDEPIVARPPSALYQLQKFARRNRSLVTGAAIAAIALVVASVVTSWLAIRATQANSLAQSRLESLERETAKLREVNEFLNQMLASANPYEGGARETTVREVLDSAAAQLDSGRLGGQVEIESEVRKTLAQLVQEGRGAEAESLLVRALHIRQRALGQDSPLTRATAQRLTELAP